MASDIERGISEAARALRGIIDPLPEGEERAFLTPKLLEIEARVQLSYLDFDKFPTTETEVAAELERQAQRYLERGLNKHPKIKLSKGKFKDSLVSLVRPQPESFAGRLLLPVAVLGQVPAKDVYEAAGVGYYLDGLDVQDWPDDPHSYTTPTVPYLTWMQDGAGNLNRKVEDVRAGLEADTRGATESDGSGLYVAHQRILTHHFIDFPGTSVGSAYAPDLDLFDDGPRVSGGWVGSARPRFGSALCGRD